MASLNLMSNDGIHDVVYMLYSMAVSSLVWTVPSRQRRTLPTNSGTGGSSLQTIRSRWNESRMQMGMGNVRERSFDGKWCALRSSIQTWALAERSAWWWTPVWPFSHGGTRCTCTRPIMTRDTALGRLATALWRSPARETGYPGRYSGECTRCALTFE